MANNEVGLGVDLVISVAELGCLESWKLSGPQIVAMIQASEYWLIVPDSQLSQFVANSPIGYTVIPESVFIQDFSEKFGRCKGDALPGRRGWYLQQLIKLSALERSSHRDRVVIWDADTVPLRQISFFDSHGNCSYYLGSEFHLPYFENIKRLLGMGRANTNSFIAQNFPITGNQIEAFFTFIETRHQKNWWDAVISTIDFDEASGFSEYETLGTFVSSLSHEPLKIQKGTWSRNGTHHLVSKLLRSGGARKRVYDFVAIEVWTDKKWKVSTIQGFLRKLLLSFLPRKNS